MINRIKILRKELKYDWSELNLVYKSLVIIGGLLLLIIVYFTVTGVGYSQMSKNIEMTFRSSLPLIFGFILSSNIKNTNKKNIRSKYLIKKDDNDNKKICQRNYDYRDGNYVQILITLIIILVSAVMILAMYRNSIFVDLAILAQFRDLMCISIGFLLGESKVKLE